jgi:hypothetical protein
LPSDLWDIEQWPSPSAEGVVRARVRRRATILLTRRLAPVVAAVIVATAGMLSHLPSGESSSRLLVTDQHGHHGTTTTTGLVSASGDGLVDLQAPPAPRRGPHGQPGGGGPGSPATSGDGPAAAATDRHPVVTDPAGDAFFYATGDACCLSTTAGASQPAFDLTACDVTLAGSRLRITMNIVDLTRAPDPDPYTGSTIGYEFWRARLGYDNGEFFLTVTRDLRRGTLAVNGHFDRPRLVASVHDTFPVTSVVGGVDLARNVVTLDVGLDALNAALAADSQSAHAAIGPGSTVVPQFESGGGAEDGSVSPSSGQMDAAWNTVAYRLGD